MSSIWAVVSNYLDKNIAQPYPTKPIDPLSYDGITKVMIRWVSAYCRRCWFVERDVSQGPLIQLEVTIETRVWHRVFVIRWCL